MAQLPIPDAESKESTHPLVFTSTKWARTTDFSDKVVLSTNITKNQTSRNAQFFQIFIRPNQIPVLPDQKYDKMKQ